MLVTPSGIVMPVKLLQPENVLPLMLVTLSGITMLVRLWHHSNAPYPMLVTPSGMVMLVRLLHLENARSPMLVTPSGTVTSPPEPTYPVKTPFLITKSLALLIFLSSYISSFCNTSLMAQTGTSGLLYSSSTNTNAV